MMGVADELLAPGGAIYEQLLNLGYSMSNYTTGNNTFYEQIYQSKFISEHFDQFSGLSDKLVQMDYSFLGLDLSQTPTGSSGASTSPPAPGWSSACLCSRSYPPA